MAIVEVVFLIVVWSWVFTAALFVRNTFLPPQPITLTPSQLQLPSETVRFLASDGVGLEGWKIPGAPQRPWVIGCHGVGSNRADLLETAAALHRAGFNVLLFDFRGHGGSDGRVTSFGYLEQRDLEGALAFLGGQPDVPVRPYGVYGISMGAVVALMVAARDERIGAVAADSPYTDLDESLGRHLTLIYPVPRIPFHWFLRTAYLARFGVWPGRVSPIRSVRKLSPRPLLLIQGKLDQRMPLAGAQAILAQAGKPKELWVIDGAAHLEGYGQDPAAYNSRLVRFFQASLK